MEEQGPSPACLGQVVLPGDEVMRLPEVGVVRVGVGLQQDGDALVALKPGVLRKTEAGRLWVAGNQRRYLPLAGDPVVGTVVDRHSENFTVELGAPFRALLPVLAFEGATRRNRPNLKVGDVVYCRVEAAPRDGEATLACTDAAGKASGFGPLSGGCVFEVPGATARALLERPPPAALVELGRRAKFEIAPGANGKVWVDSPSSGTTILVAAVLQHCDQVLPQQVPALVEALARRGGQDRE